MTAGLFALLLCMNAAGQAFTVSSDLFDQSRPDDLGLVRAAGTETHTIFTPSESTDHFCNGAVMTAFKKNLYCMWQSSARDEDAPDTWVAYSRSTDGIHWTKPMVLAQSIPDGYCTSGGWWVHKDTLIAYINVWPDSVTPRGGYTAFKTSPDGLSWSETKPVSMSNGLPLNGVFEQDPHALPNGRIISAAHFQPGLTVSPVYTDDPSGTGGWVRAAFTNLPHTGNVSREIEPSWFLKKDGTLVMTFRDQNSTFRKLASVSADLGTSWSPPEPTDMPDARTKQSNGNLPDGTAYMVGSPTGSKWRFPLTVTLSDSGDCFDRAVLLRAGGDDLPPLVYPGKAKRPGFHYPKSMVWNGHLYVTYCTNKEKVEVTRVSLETLTARTIRQRAPVKQTSFSRQ